MILTCGTSQVERAIERRKGIPQETVVTVTPKECPELKKEDGELNYKGKLTDSVLTKLISGTLGSPMAERKYKKIIGLA